MAITWPRKYWATMYVGRMPAPAATAAAAAPTSAPGKSSPSRRARVAAPSTTSTNNAGIVSFHAPQPGRVTGHPDERGRAERVGAGEVAEVHAGDVAPDVEALVGDVLAHDRVRRGVVVAERGRRQVADAEQRREREQEHQAGAGPGREGGDMTAGFATDGRPPPRHRDRAADGAEPEQHPADAVRAAAADLEPVPGDELEDGQADQRGRHRVRPSCGGVEQPQADGQADERQSAAYRGRQHEELEQRAGHRIACGPSGGRRWRSAAMGRHRTREPGPGPGIGPRLGPNVAGDRHVARPRGGRSAARE